MDWLKTIAILAVLLLHCSSKYLLPDFVFQPNWYCGVFFESLSRFGVPLFIMVSGFLILRKDQPIYLCDKNGTLAPRAALTLKKNGYTNIYMLKNGLQDWKENLKTKK